MIDFNALKIENLKVRVGSFFGRFFTMKYIMKNS